MGLRISIDDGCISDLRIADICQEYGIGLTLYIPVEWQALAYEGKNKWKPLRYYDLNQLIKSGVQLGSHGITHRLLTRIPAQQAKDEIEASQWILGSMFDTQVDKFAPARGYTNSELTKHTLEIYEEQRLTTGDDLVHIHPESGVQGRVHWRKVADDKLKVQRVKNLELWGHSWEIAKYDLWEEILDFLDDYKFLKTAKYEAVSSE